MLFTVSLLINLFFFAFTLWLGAYLLARNPGKKTVQLTGFGLIFFALALALEIVAGQQPNALLLIPALFWIGATLYLIPEEIAWRRSLIRVWMLAAIPAFILTLVNPWFSLIGVTALFASVYLLASLRRHAGLKNTSGTLTMIGLFFSLSTGLLVLPLQWLPRAWIVAFLGLDLVLLGVAILLWDAFDEGESIRSHLVRSLIASFYYAGALAALVFLAVAIDGRMTFGTLVSLVMLVAFGILVQVFSVPLQVLVDRLTMSTETNLNDQREILRQTADALPRLSTLNPVDVEEEEFARLTRRAISHLGDLPKLAASPLLNLPGILPTDTPNPLDRALALKALLVESIQRLKPQSADGFGTTDEWRYYNSLYFPYVLGLKPYTRHPNQDSLDETGRQALDWFQYSVPERTLHNWQNAAAKLVAEDLRLKR